MKQGGYMLLSIPEIFMKKKGNGDMFLLCGISSTFYFFKNQQGQVCRHRRKCMRILLWPILELHYTSNDYIFTYLFFFKKNVCSMCHQVDVNS